jgi:hypothetical protein
MGSRGWSASEPFTLLVDFFSFLYIVSLRVVGGGRARGRALLVSGRLLYVWYSM